jgi:hypothetical protein
MNVLHNDLNKDAIKKGRPYTDFPMLCDLDESKCLDIGNKYRNNKKSCWICNIYFKGREQQDMYARLVGPVNCLFLKSTPVKSVFFSPIIILQQLFLLFLYLFPMSKHFDSSRSHNIGKSVYGLPFLVSANTFLNNRVILLNCNWFIVLRALAPSEFSGYCCPLYLMTLNWCASDFSCWLIKRDFRLGPPRIRG